MNRLILFMSRERAYKYPSGESRIGEYKVITTVPADLHENITFTPDAVVKFYRIQLKGGELVYSNEYLRARRSDNCTVMLVNDSCGSVEYFLEVQGNSSITVLACISVFTTAKTTVAGILMPHLYNILGKVRKYVPASQIKHKCIYIKVGSNEYVSIPYTLCTSLPM